MNTPTPRKDERGGSSGLNSERKNRRNLTSNEEGWSTASSRSRGPPLVIHSEKLKNKTVNLRDKLINSSSSK